MENYIELDNGKKCEVVGMYTLNNKNIIVYLDGNDAIVNLFKIDQNKNIHLFEIDDETFELVKDMVNELENGEDDE